MQESACRRVGHLPRPFLAAKGSGNQTGQHTSHPTYLVRTAKPCVSSNVNPEDLDSGKLKPQSQFVADRDWLAVHSPVTATPTSPSCFSGRHVLVGVAFLEL